MFGTCLEPLLGNGVASEMGEKVAKDTLNAAKPIQLLIFQPCCPTAVVGWLVVAVVLVIVDLLVRRVVREEGVRLAS